MERYDNDSLSLRFGVNFCLLKSLLAGINTTVHRYVPNNTYPYVFNVKRRKPMYDLANVFSIPFNPKCYTANQQYGIGWVGNIESVTVFLKWHFHNNCFSLQTITHTKLLTGTINNSITYTEERL